MSQTAEAAVQDQKGVQVESRYVIESLQRQVTELSNKLALTEAVMAQERDTYVEEIRILREQIDAFASAIKEASDDKKPSLTDAKNRKKHG